MGFKTLLVFSLILISGFSHAGKQTGTITEIIVRQSDGLHYFHMSGTASNRPACADGHAYWMIRDENSTAGKSQLSLLLAAYMSGKKVIVNGSNKCMRWGDGEDVDSVHLF